MDVTPIDQFKAFLAALEGGWTPSTAEAVRAAEQRMAVTFPDWLVNVLTSCGRCVSKDVVVRGQTETDFPLDNVFDLEKVEWAFDNVEGYRENQLIPFADSFLEGSPFVYAVTSGSIWFLDYYRGFKRHHVSDSFADFVSRMRIVEDADQPTSHPSGDPE